MGPPPVVHSPRLGGLGRRMRLLDENPILGIKRYFHYLGDTFVIETRQDVGGIVEANKRQYNSHDGKRFGKGDFHHVGRIPISLYYEWVKNGDETDIRRFLNLSDNRAWKTHPGTI